MIFKALFSLILVIPKLVISLFPSISIEIPENIMGYMSYICQFIGYFIPIKGLFVLFMINFTIDSAHIIWIIILKIKSFIPFLGG